MPAEGRPTKTDDPATQLVEDIAFRCLEADDVDAAIERETTSHPELRDRVRNLLEALRSRGLLDRESTPDRIPERLGEFKLLDRLGAGGMGIVFLAEQEGLGRRVALKLIRPEQLYFPGSRERFQREVEAVARLQHPGIVPVFTVGEDGGLPYFSMEYVAGCSLADVLDDFSDRSPAELGGADLARLLDDRAVAEPHRGETASRRAGFGRPWAEVCVLFAIEVAEALEHAHERGVLHRDVKPSNVLIALDGRARLVDFGLARTEGAQQLTRTTTQLGSLPYLPPEQLDERTRIASVRQDVYSLGVTLYEMLALRSPFLGATVEETRRRIVEGKPASPRDRNGSISWDLETVCLTAMDPDPTRRYPDVGALLRDLLNVRDTRPIEARRPNAAIRLRRWAQRHPTLTAASAVGVVLAAVAAIVVAMFESSARQQADRLTAEAERRATEATHVADFVVNLFEYASPDRSMGEDLPVRQLLARGTDRIEAELSEQPAVRARLYGTLGRVYTWLGEHEKANDLYERAVALTIELHGPDHPEVLESQLSQTVPWGGLERHEEALELLDSIAQRVQRLLRGAHTDRDEHLLTKVLRRRAQAHRRLGRVARAEEIARSALVRDRRLLDEHGPEHRAELWKTLHTIAIVLHDGDRFDEAQAYFDEGLDLVRTLHPEGHPNELSLRRARARNLTMLGRHAAAETALVEVLTVTQNVYGKEHLNVAGVRLGLSNAVRKSGRHEEALRHLQAARTILENSPLATKRFLARTLNDLGTACVELGQRREARDLLERALGMAREVFRDDHPQLAIPMSNLADVLTLLGDLERAEELARASLAMEARLAPEGRRHAAHLTVLSYVLSRRGQRAEAERLATEAIRIAELWPTERWHLGRAHSILAMIHNESGRAEQAERAAARAATIFDGVRAGPNAHKGLALYNRGWACHQLGELDRAVAFFRESIEVLRVLPPEGKHPDLVWALNFYGQMLLEDRVDEAAELFEQALEIRRRDLSRGDYWLVLSINNLARAYMEQRDFAEAEPLLLEARASCLETRGAKDQLTRAITTNVWILYRDWGKADEAEKYAALLRDREP